MSNQGFYFECVSSPDNDTKFTPGTVYRRVLSVNSSKPLTVRDNYGRHQEIGNSCEFQGTKFVERAHPNG